MVADEAAANPQPQAKSALGPSETVTGSLGPDPIHGWLGQGAVIDSYQLLELIGEGGMGEVWLAEQREPVRRRVAIKLVKAGMDTREVVARFESERQALALMDHPAIAKVFDAGSTAEGRPYFVMEYVAGLPITLYCDRHKLNMRQRFELFISVCEGVQHAHQKAIIHRDLKPSNIMIVDHDTPREKIKVMDFGLAKLMIESTTIKNVTESNFDFAVGTPGYICPEQVRGETVDHRGDIYSVGVIMYELLTGRLPFIGPSSMDLMLAHATEKPPSFASLELADQIPAAVEQVVLAALEKDPNDRPQSARDLMDLYDTALSIGEMGLPDASPEDQEPEQSSAPIYADPTTLTFQLEAWMPESIAIMKIRGYAHDVGGEILDSVPGLVRLQIGPNGGTSKSRKPGLMGLNWFGFGRRNEPVSLELHLHQIDPAKSNRLFLHVVFRPHSISQLNDPVWRERCTELFIELRAFLMGTSEILEAGNDPP
jgi:eukaryotic-like serine/threonine-protein kinase